MDSLSRAPLRIAALLGVLLTGGALAGGGAFVDGLGAASEWATGERVGPVCPFRARTGLPCMGCGGTHAFHAATRGRLSEAVRTSPLGAFAGLATWFLSLGLVTTVLSGRPRVLFWVFLIVVALAPVALIWNGVHWWLSLPVGSLR